MTSIIEAIMGGSTGLAVCWAVLKVLRWRSYQACLVSIARLERALGMTAEDVLGFEYMEFTASAEAPMPVVRTVTPYYRLQFLGEP